MIKSLSQGPKYVAQGRGLTLEGDQSAYNTNFFPQSVIRRSILSNQENFKVNALVNSC